MLLEATNLNAYYGESHALRDMVVQFDHDLIARTSEMLPELRELAPLLERARSGVKFLDMDEAARDFMHAIRDASGPTRLGHFCAFMSFYDWRNKSQ